MKIEDDVTLGSVPSARSATLRGPLDDSLMQVGPAVSADDMEIAHLASVEVMVLWGDTVLHVSHLTPPRDFYVGESSLSDQTRCDFFMPAEVLGADRFPIVLANDVSTVVVVPAGAILEIDLPDVLHGHLDGPGDGLVGRPSSHVSGAFEYDLPAGTHARIRLAGSGIAFHLTMANAGRAAPRGPFHASDSLGPALYTGLSFLFHLGMLAIFAFFMPKMDGDDGEAIDNDKLLLMQKLLNAAAERETELPDEVAPPAAHPDLGNPGARAMNAEGKAGSVSSRETGHRYGVAGPKDNPDPHPARQAAVAEAATFAPIGMLASMLGGDPHAPTAPWGHESSSGADEKSALGNIFGSDIGESAGIGGLGGTGTDEGGGGHLAAGIGLDDIGALGRGGIGGGHAPGSRGHKVAGVKLPTGNLQIGGGRIPAEVIQRIVRLNQGRYRLCYENGLRQNPNLQGRIAVKFVIDRTGAVMLAADGGSDLPDSSVVSCIVNSFRNLSFPSPEGGMVTVTYPLTFTAPSDG